MRALEKTPRFAAAPTTLTLFLTVALAAAACDQVPDASDDVTERTSALFSRFTYTDLSGNLQFSIKTCTATPLGSGLRCAYCPVDAGYVLIGGGAQIVGSPASARLKASRPDNEGTATGQGCTGDSSGSSTTDIWLARSYSVSPTQHQLQAYSVGMKVTGMTEAELHGYVGFNENTTGFVAQPSMTLDAPPGQMLVSGGAELLGPDASGPSGYLTELRPVDPLLTNSSGDSFRASGLFTGGTTGSLKALVIGISYSLPIPSGGMLRRNWKVGTSSTGTGYRNVTVSSPYPYVFASGGSSRSGGSTRYLSDLILPAAAGQGFTATTNDETAGASGATTAYVASLAEHNYQPYWFNSIRFNASGTTFSRPTGAAPVDLQQANAFPDAAPYRWYLEAMPGGNYRIRNGNPSQGTECACRVSGNLNVRVTTCGTSNDFLWTLLDGSTGNGPFKLRNVANGRCIDNNGQGAVTSTLVFRSCAVGYSTNQSLFADAYSWPP